MGVAYFLLLSGLGIAVTVQAQECSRPVGGSNMSLRDDDILLTQFPEGITVAFACDVGYMSAGGSGRITCTNGIWSSLNLKCQRKSCGSAGDIANGDVHYPEGNEFGDKITITCNPGYMLVGKSEIFCGDKGWMGRFPTCEVTKCDSPPKISNGTFSPVKDDYAYAEVVQYTCIPDYTLNGSKSLSCSDDGKFKPDPPICTYVECKEPTIENAKWKDGSRPPYRYKASVIYECNKGYSLEGESTLTCTINSQWSPELPKCIRTVVTTKPTTTTTTTTTTTHTPPAAHTPSATPGSGSDGGSSSYTWIIVCGVLLLVIVVIAGMVWLYQQKHGRRISHGGKEATNGAETELRNPINPISG